MATGTNGITTIQDCRDLNPNSFVDNKIISETILKKWADAWTQTTMMNGDFIKPYGTYKKLGSIYIKGGDSYKLTGEFTAYQSDTDTILDYNESTILANQYVYIGITNSGTIPSSASSFVKHASIKLQPRLSEDVPGYVGFSLNLISAGSYDVYMWTNYMIQPLLNGTPVTSGTFTVTIRPSVKFITYDPTTYDPLKCPTYAEIVNDGSFVINNSSNYTSDQLVKYASLTQTASVGIGEWE